MGLRAKFNLLLLAAFAVRHLVSAAVDWRTLEARARAEVVQQAGMMLAMADAVRHYTGAEVAPALTRDGAFHPPAAPFFAAKATLADFSRRMPDYRFKVAALDPTNPTDRAAPWEAKLIANFAAHPSLAERVVVRRTAAGPMLSLARPVRLADPACLACHSTPAAAPAGLVRHYGARGGFGWKLGGVPAAAIVSVPLAVPLDRAWRHFLGGLVRSAEMVAFALVLINLLLHYLIVRPVRRMAEIAAEVSLGNTDAPEFAARGGDEIASLGRSFNRMRRSFQNAMKLLEG